MRGSVTSLGSPCDDAPLVTALGQHSLGRAVRAAGIDAEPVWIEETGSTNDEARDMAERGAPAWTVVAAGHQTGGRGRLGRSWADAPETALLFSVILRPDLRPDQAPLLTLQVATAVIAAVGDPGLRSKWPNDLVFGDRKAGGILAEGSVSGGRLAHLVVGVGVNMSAGTSDFPPELRDGATSLAIEGVAADPADILTATLSALRDPRSPPEIVDAYRSVCRTLGRRVRATTTEGRAVEGPAVDLDERGDLVVETPAGRRTVAFGEVVHLR
jgi:BirA family transcriptional regulator, biotin operon repressor / biotin---[acetyl-CoA-carboxylase] ligase